MTLVAQGLIVCTLLVSIACYLSMDVLQHREYWLWSNLSFHPGSCLEKLTKITETLMRVFTVWPRY